MGYHATYIPMFSGYVLLKQAWHVLCLSMPKQFKGLRSILVCGASDGSQSPVHTRKHSTLQACVGEAFCGL